MREAIEPKEYEDGDIVMNRVICRIGRVEAWAAGSEGRFDDTAQIRYADDWLDITPFRFLRHATDEEIAQYNEKTRKPRK